SPIPSEEEVLGWTESLKNWGRWGEDDELGTLNFVTPEVRRRAVALVREGITVSCAHPITYDPAPDGPIPTRHFMMTSGEAFAHEGGPATVTFDAFLIAPHGLTMTHLDGLCHFIWQGQMYNGRPAHRVTTREGGLHGSVEVPGAGVITRGVLLDIAGLKG